jgi:hypothetical protein
MLFFLFYLTGGLKPGGPASAKGAHFFVAVLYESERRTGARMFARSGTISNDFAVARNLFEMRLDLIVRNFQSADYLFLVGIQQPGIDYRDRLFLSQHQYQFVYGHSLDLIKLGIVLIG